MLLKTSLSGGILILLVIILRFLLNGKLPKRTFSLLWDIVLLRLLIPFDLPFKYGIAVPVINTTSSASNIHPGTIKLPSGTKNPFSSQTVNNTNNLNIPVLLWITVMIILLTTFTFLYLKEYKRIQENTRSPACIFRPGKLFNTTCRYSIKNWPVSFRQDLYTFNFWGITS